MLNLLKKIYNNHFFELNIFVVFLMAVFVFSSGHFIFVNAYNNQVNIFPGAYSMEEPEDGAFWENINNSFYQDLSGQAGFYLFKQNNSAYLTFSKEEGNKSGTTGIPGNSDASDFDSSGALNDSVENAPPKSGAEEDPKADGPAVGDDTGADGDAPAGEEVPVRENGTEAEAEVPASEEEAPPVKSDNINAGQKPVLAPEEPVEPVPTAEDAIKAEPGETSLLDKGFFGFERLAEYWRIFSGFSLKSARAEDNKTPDEELNSASDNSGQGPEKGLIFSDFSIPIAQAESKIGRSLLMLSLAASSSITGDELTFRYSLGSGWKDLGRLELTGQLSNAANGNYFQFPLPLETWDDVGNLKISVNYYHNRKLSQEEKKALKIFLDALWLKVDYDEIGVEGGAQLSDTEQIGRQEEAGSEDIELNLLSDKTDFNNSEKPFFNFEYKKIRSSLLGKIGAEILGIFRDEYKNTKITAEVYDYQQDRLTDIRTDVEYQANGKFNISLPFNERQFRPGKFRLKLKIEDSGNFYRQEQDFSWGVLAFNSNKSVFLPGETAYLQMGVLDDEGHTLCNADLYLEIIAPDGGIAYLNTDNGLIRRNKNCAGDTVITSSDYSAYYDLAGTGVYQVKLTASTTNGNKEINDMFEARDYAPFAIERIGPTRIYPPANYEMKFRITANEDYEGEFREFTPGSFKILKSVSSGPLEIIGSENENILSWHVDWQAGKSYEINYTFDAPDISPEFYLLGPAEVKPSRFVEVRQWQIAGDAVLTYEADMGRTVSFTNPSYAWDYPTTNLYANYSYAKKGTDGPANYLQASSTDITEITGATITKVEIGAECYGENGDINAELIPYFNGTSAGNTHNIPKATIGSSDSNSTFYAEVTTDTNAPSPWTWSDLENLEVRVWGDNDSNSRSRNFYVDQIRIRVEYTPPNDTPTTTILSAAEKNNGSGAVDIAIEAGDGDGDNTQAILEYESGSSCAFASPLDPTLDETDANATSTYGDAKILNSNFYQIGNSSGWIETTNGSNQVYFDWNSKTNLPAGDGAYCLRLRVNDTKATSTAATTTLTIDNVSPSAPGGLSVFAISGTSVIMSFGATSSDTNFSGYKIYYKEYDGTDPDTGDNEWNSGDDINLGEADFNSATSTAITDLFPSTQYIFNIYSFDAFGNAASATTAVLATTSAQAVSPVLTINSLAQKTDGSGGVDISVEVDDGNDDDARVKMEYEAGSSCQFSPPLDPILDETPASISADFGTVIIDNASAYQIGTSSGWIKTASGSNTINFDWLSESHSPDLDGVYCVRFTANDTSSGDQTNPATTTVLIDNTSPSAPGQMSATTTDRTVTLFLGASSTETNFSEYKIFYKVGSSGVSEGDSEYNSSDDLNLGYQDYNGAESVTISGLTPELQYVFNIWAYDDYGNKASSSEITATTLEAEPIRAKTVMFPAGVYSGNGSGGQNSDVNLSFSSFNFRLAEGSVEIKDAYIIFEAQFEAYADNSFDYTGYNLAFDACQESCSTDAFAGSGRILKDDNTVLAFDETESNQVRLLLDVTNETQLAAYTGNGVNMEGRVGYRIEAGGATESIASAKAILVITYTYNENDTANLTNTVVYPLESQNSGDSGSRRSVQADDCVLNSSCPLFDYKMDIPEFSSKLADWFEIYSAIDRNSGVGQDYQDIFVNVNIQGEDINSDNFVYETANGLTQSHLPAMYFKSVYGFSENATSTLEVHPDCTSGSAKANFYLIGGEAFETYIASSSASVKTRTASFPIGVVNNGLTTSQTSASVDVYFPENGAGAGTINVKKAWVRLISNNYTSSGNITVSTDVGSNPQSGNYIYAYDTDTAVAKPSFNIIHVIPSSDYAELALANAATGKTVTLYTTNSSLTQGGLSAELMITYTYTDESSGYLSSLNLFAGQSDSTGNDQLASATVAEAVLPEIVGNKTVLSGALLSSYLVSSDDAGGVPSAAFTFDANIATDSPSCSNAFNSRPLDSNIFTEFYKGVTSALSASDGENYFACYSNNGGSNASTGAKMNGQLIYVYQYDAPLPVFTQNDWRWYENIDEIEPATAKAGENAIINNVNLADELRLRINVGVTGRALATTSETFSLQYGVGADCAGISTWNSVSAIGGGGPWEGYDNSSVADGYSSSSLLLASSTVFESYEEENPAVANPRFIAKYGYGEWDWVLYNNSATSSRDYCFRMITSSGSFDTYNADGYAKLTTAATNTKPANPSALAQYRDDEATIISNTGWINENNVKLKAQATDVNINENISLYFQVASNTSSFITATSVPSSPCLYGTAYNNCSSKVWVATSTTGDYRTNAFIATTSITEIPDLSIGYKWQVMACDDDGDCSNWKQFAVGPNFRVDITPPDPPGSLSLAAANATSLTIGFGASTTEENFDEYRMYYKTGGYGVSEANTPHNDTNLNNINYNNATSTLVSNLAAGTQYVFNIWAYDFAGNKASATLELMATTTSSFSTSSGVIFSLAQKTNGSGAVDITILVDDPDNDDTLRARTFYSPGASCVFSPANDMTIDPVNISSTYSPYPDVDNTSLYQVGTNTAWILTSPGANFVFYDWLSKNEEPAANGTYCIGLVVSDGFTHTATDTQLIIVDNIVPGAPGALTLENKNRSSITVHFNGQSSDTRFDRYRIFYSTSSAPTVYDSEYTDYFGATTTNFGGLATTTISGLDQGTLYYINIWAFDDLGNNASSSIVLATSTNAIATNTLAIEQYLSDEVTAIPNSSWVNENEVRLVASTNDPDTSELPTLYFEFIPSGSSFTTATTVPQNACVYGTSYAGCSVSHVWFSAPASPGNYSVVPYTATTSITAIPNSSTGYKWQVLGCDDDGDCANSWTRYNDVIPNFKVDITAPGAPGALSEYSKTSRIITLSFGSATDEANFSEYRIYYSTSSPATENDVLFSSSTDSNLGAKNYNNAATTTISGLEPDTTYYINIWAYDTAGNKASSTQTAITTNAVASTPGVIFYTKNSRTLYYRVWSGTAWGGEQSGPDLGSAAGDNIRHIRALRSDDGKRIGILAKTWDGVNQEWWGTVYRVAADDFVNSAILGSAQTDGTNAELITGCLASLSDNEFFIIRNNNASNGTLVYSWNSADGWTSESAGPDPGAVVNGCRLIRRPNTDNYLLMTFDDTNHGGQINGDVGSAYYYGGAAYTDSWTSWTEHGYPEEDTDNYVGEAFFDPSDNTRGGINYSASNNTADTKIIKFIAGDSTINYGAPVTSPAGWSGDFVHGEFAADPGGTGVAFYVGDDINGEVNVYKVNISTSTPSWFVTANGDNISGSGLYTYTNNAQKPYAIAFYKNNYGIAAWNGAAAVTPKYRVIDALGNSVDSSDTAIPGADANVWSRVRFYNDPNENEILGVYQNDDVDYAAVFWNGSEDRFYDTTNDPGSEQVWTELATTTGPFDYDDECTAFAFTAGNSYPNSPNNLTQYKTDASAVIANGGWTNENSIKLEASVKDPDTSEILRIYAQVLAGNDDFATSTGVPQNICASTTVFASCNSKIWAVATSTADDYSINPFVATATILSLPESYTLGYKWQVKACDDNDACTSWVKYNAATPNFYVDYTLPQNLGALQASGKTSISVTLNFGSAVTESNFSEYKIFYSTSSPVTENDYEHSDSDLGYQDYHGTSDTTVYNLEPETLYYFNIWAYDLAGNKASSTIVSTTTNSTYHLAQRAYLIENDDGLNVNGNTAEVANNTPLNNLYKGERLNVRIQIENTGGDMAANKVYKLQYENQTDSPGTWNDVGAATEISYSLGLSGANNDDITGWKIANGNSFTFGKWHENVFETNTFSLNYAGFTEFVFAVKTNNALEGKNYGLRLYNETDNSALDAYYATATISIIASSTKRYSKGTYAVLLNTTADLTYYLDPEGYADAAVDDGERDIATSTANIPVFNFVAATSTNSQAINAVWNGQSSESTATNTVYLQVFRFGSTNAWVTAASNSTTSADTDFSLSANINSNLSEYYSSNRTYWRVYQDSGNNALKTDYFNISFSDPVPEAKQMHYRWRTDNGDETSASWLEDEDTGSPTASSTLDKYENIRLRIEVANLGGGSASNYNYQIEYAFTTGNCSTDPGGWWIVPTDSSEHWQMGTSTYFDNASTTSYQLDNSEAYSFTSGYMVEDPKSTSSPISLTEGYYTEVEYVMFANSNAVSAGTYCFRVSNNGTALDDYDIFPVITLSGVTNSAPYFTTYPSDNGSATNSPTNYGTNVEFTATADDTQSDDYYLAVCKTPNVTAGNDAPPTCDGGAWCVSTLASSTDPAYCSYTAAASSESLDWYAFVCDKYPGFSVAKCSTYSQGQGSADNNSPFVINHPPVFTSVSTTDDNKDPGGKFTITTVSADSDSLGSNDTLNLFVCTMDNANSGGCQGVGNQTICSALGTSSPNAKCYYTDTAPTPAADYTYYAFVFDNHNLDAATNSRSNTYTVNNVAPKLGAQSLNGGVDIILSPSPANTAVSVVNASVVDENGCDSGLVSAVAVIYMSATTSDCVQDDNECYQITPANCIKSNCDDDSDDIATYTCSANFKYFADPTDDYGSSSNNPWKSYVWLGWIQIYDGANYTASTSPGVEVKTTLAFDVNEDLIDFGNDLYVGDNTGTKNATSTVVNAGNSPIFTNVSGTDMAGIPSGTISVGQIKWSLTESFNYTSTGTPLTAGGDDVPIIAPKPNSSSTSSDEIYWGIGIPLVAEANVYYGENTFVVYLDKNGWPE